MLTPAAVLHVTGTPRPKQSARFVNGRVVSVAAARKLLKLWTAALKAEARRWKAGGGIVMDGALEVRIDCYFATPKAARWGQPHTHIPDKDNCEKAILDALKGIVFVDDCRVSGGGTWKWWAEKAGAVITVSQVGQPDTEDDDDLGAASIDGTGQPD